VRRTRSSGGHLREPLLSLDNLGPTTVARGGRDDVRARVACPHEEQFDVSWVRSTCSEIITYFGGASITYDTSQIWIGGRRRKETTHENRVDEITEESSWNQPNRIASVFETILNNTHKHMKPRGQALQKQTFESATALQTFVYGDRPTRFGASKPWANPALSTLQQTRKRWPTRYAGIRKHNRGQSVEHKLAETVARRRH